jgi:hypothetical protein
MGSLTHWIEALKQWAAAVEFAEPLTALLEDPSVLSVSALHLLACAWLIHRWVMRHRPRSRRPSHGLRAAAGALGTLSAVVGLVLGLLLAVARAEGRSTFHSGARF